MSSSKGLFSVELSCETNGGVLMHFNFDSFIIIIVIFLFENRDAKHRDFSVSESIVL